MRDQKRQELARLVTSISGKLPRPASTLLRMAARSIAGAPAVIAIANTGDLIRHGTQLFKVEKEMAHDFFRTMEIQSSAAAVQNLLLAATSLGLATVWLGILYPVRNNAPLLPLGQAPPRKGSCPGGRPSLRARGSSEPEAGPAAAAGLDFRIIPGSTP